MKTSELDEKIRKAFEKESLELGLGGKMQSEIVAMVPDKSVTVIMESVGRLVKSGAFFTTEHGVMRWHLNSSAFMPKETVRSEKKTVVIMDAELQTLRRMMNLRIRSLESDKKKYAGRDHCRD